MAPIKKKSNSKEDTNKKDGTRKRGRPIKPVEKESNDKKDLKTTKKTIEENTIQDLDVSNNSTTEEVSIKRKRGRPPKLVNGIKVTKEKIIDPSVPKRGRGRPRKTTTESS